MVTVFDVASGVRIRLGAANIPSTLSDGSIADLATDRLSLVAEWLGQSLDSGNFAVRFKGPLSDLVTADVIAVRDNTDIDTGISVGNISLSYSDKNSANARMIEYFLNRAQLSLNTLGTRRIVSTYTTKAD